MNLTKRQCKARDLIISGPQVTRIQGYAGSGKTACIAEAVRGRAGVQVLAPTGKAAQNLRRKAGNDPVLASAATIHSWLYRPTKRIRRDWLNEAQKLGDKLPVSARPLVSELIGLDPDAEPGNIFKQIAKAADSKHVSRWEALRTSKRWELAFEQSGAIDYFEQSGEPLAATLVIDEASMVSEAVVRDLQRTGSRLVFVGDPAQLSPVRAQASREAMGDPHVLLDKVHRQGEGSDILALATLVREGRISSLPTTARKKLLDLTAYDQILCWRNATRQELNREVRILLGRTDMDEPEPGDKIVCIQNTRHRRDDSALKRWMNGEQAEVFAIHRRMPGMWEMTVRSYDDGALHRVLTPTVTFTGPTAEQEYRDRSHGGPDPVFAFGYALTVHKSQGSEWGKVLVIDEVGSMRDRDDQRRWRYTAITRAKSLLHVADRIPA